MGHPVYSTANLLRDTTCLLITLSNLHIDELIELSDLTDVSTILQTAQKPSYCMEILFLHETLIEM